MSVASFRALFSLFSSPLDSSLSRVVPGNELLTCFGSFWGLFNRMKRGSVDVVAILAGGVSDADAKRVFSSIAIIPWERGPEFREKIRQAFQGENPSRQLVFLVPQECSSEEALKGLRLVSSVPELSDSLRRGRTVLHVWRLGPNRVLRVFDPEKQDFVCPLATI